jgi:hypothetical protein
MSDPIIACLFLAGDRRRITETYETAIALAEREGRYADAAKLATTKLCRLSEVTDDYLSRHTQDVEAARQAAFPGAPRIAEVAR